MRKAALFLATALIGFAPLFAAAADAPAPQAAIAPVPATLPPPATPAAAPAFTDAQRAEIENIIKEYLTEKNPEVLATGLQEYQKRAQDTAEVKTKEELASNKDKIFNDPTAPVGGNPKGNVVIAEFFDYQCGYCKMSEDGIERLLKDDKNVKFVYRDFPILGPVSTEAAKASLASAKQGKYQAFHDTLMSKKTSLSSDLIYEVAKEVGLNVEKLKKDMAENSINDALNANLKLGQDVGVRGTPMFIINDTTHPGAMQYDELVKAVNDARADGKKS